MRTLTITISVIPSIIHRYAISIATLPPEVFTYILIDISEKYRHRLDIDLPIWPIYRHKCRLA